MKVFSNHRKKIEPHRRFGGREFKDKLSAAKNYKRTSFNSQDKPSFFARTGFSQVGVYSAGVGIAAIFYFLVIAPTFLVTKIAVAGNVQIPASDIVDSFKSATSHRFFLVPQSSIFFLSSGRVNQMLTKNIPLVASVASHRHWPNGITLDISERIPALTLVEDNKNYLVDDQGFVVGQIDAPKNLVIEDQISEDIKEGTTIDGKLIPFIISMQKTWPTKIPIQLSGAKIPGIAASEVEFVSSEGWSVFFSTDRPVSTQLDNLALLLNKSPTAKDRANLAYIDLRIAKWAYLCSKNAPCIQTDQSQTAINSLTGPQTSGAATINPQSTPTPDSTNINQQ